MRDVHHLVALIFLLVGTYLLFGQTLAGLLALLMAPILLEEQLRTQWGVRVASFLFLFAVIHMLQSVLLPFAIGGLLGFLMGPLVRKLERWGIPRPVSGVVLLLLLISGFIALGSGVVYQILEESNRLLTRISVSGVPWDRWVQRFFPQETQIELTRLSENLLSMVREIAQEILQNLRSLGSGLGVVATRLFYLLMSLIVAYYVAVDGDRLASPLHTTLTKHFPDMEQFTLELGGILRRYFRGQLLVAVILGTFVAVSLEILGVSSGILIGVVVAITNLIPNIGFWIAFVPALLLGLLEPDPIWGMLKVVGVFGANQILEAGISPRIVGGSVQLHPLLVLFSVLIGAKFFGVLGLILAVPVAATLKIYFQRMKGLFAKETG